MGYKTRTIPSASLMAGMTIIALASTVFRAAPSPAQVAADYDWRTELEQTLGQVAPVEVEQGRMRFLVESDCPPIIEKYGRCFGNNPASPYGTYELGDFTGPADRFRWRLAENQAVIFLGLTPPTGRFFSVQPYPFSRHESKLHLPPADPEGRFCDDPVPIPQGCQTPRQTLLAKMGLSLSHLDLITDRGDEDSFDKFTVVVTTANKEVERRIRELLPRRLAELGYSPNVINIDPIPCDSVAADGTCDDSDPRNLVLGSEPEADDFIMAWRLAMTRSLTALQDYLDDPPATVLRVTFPDLSGTFVPYPREAVPTPPAMHRYNEKPYEDALDWLTRNIRDTYAPGGTAISFSSSQGPYYRCMDQESSCNASSEDAYYSSGPDITKRCVKEGQSIYVVGVNHSLAGPYSYFSLSIRSREERHEIGYFADIDYV
ncbi:MAG: hypothetical protein ACE5IK_09420, partial [Acidobacteriota bacterium]